MNNSRDATSSNVTAEDVRAYVRSLQSQGTPWSIGCAAILTALWSDLTEAKDRLTSLPSAEAVASGGAMPDMNESGWMPEQALRFYAEGRHFDIVDGRTRILDTGAVASDALKGSSESYAAMKGAPSSKGVPEELFGYVAYFYCGCTDNNCRLCKTPPHLRHWHLDLRHAGIPTFAYPKAAHSSTRASEEEVKSIIYSSISGPTQIRNVTADKILRDLRPYLTLSANEQIEALAKAAGWVGVADPLRYLHRYVARTEKLAGRGVHSSSTGAK